MCARKVGFVANRKRIQRLWRGEGLLVPSRRRKSAPLGIGVQIGAFCPIRPNVFWAHDFQFDRTDDARTLKLLNIIDEFTRECRAIVAGRSINADKASGHPRRAGRREGEPAYLRMDNGPELIANALADWCRFSKTGAIFIDPGCPWQSPWAESFNGRLRE